MSWYYLESSNTVGPIDEPQFEELVRSGKVTPDTQVWHDGQTEWRPYRECFPDRATAREAEEVSQEVLSLHERGRFSGALVSALKEQHSLNPVFRLCWDFGIQAEHWVILLVAIVKPLLATTGSVRVIDGVARSYGAGLIIIERQGDNFILSLASSNGDPLLTMSDLLGSNVTVPSDAVKAKGMVLLLKGVKDELVQEKAAQNDDAQAVAAAYSRRLAEVDVHEPAFEELLSTLAATIPSERSAQAKKDVAEMMAMNAVNTHGDEASTGIASANQYASSERTKRILALQGDVARSAAICCILAIISVPFGLLVEPWPLGDPNFAWRLAQSLWPYGLVGSVYGVSGIFVFRGSRFALGLAVALYGVGLLEGLVSGVVQGKVQYIIGPVVGAWVLGRPLAKGLSAIARLRELGEQSFRVRAPKQSGDHPTAAPPLTEEA